LGRLVKKGQRIGFDTFPLHYKEYKTIIKRAKKYEEFPKGVKIENVKTPENLKQHIYGFLGLEEERLRKGKVQYLKERKDKFIQFVKRIAKRIINLH
jgi:hypothetical protein